MKGRAKALPDIIFRTSMEKYRVRSRWVKMLSRCEDEDNLQYKDYGGRGIAVCEEWHDFNTFYIWCIKNGLEPNLQIDRTDNDGPYSPANCKIVTKTQNARNKRTTRFVTIDGKTKSAAEWIEDERCVVPYTTFLRRLNLGWTPEQALALPSGDRRISRVAHNAKKFEAFGESKTIYDWLQDTRCVVQRVTLSYRLHAGWEPERAITQPLGPQSGRK